MKILVILLLALGGFLAILFMAALGDAWLTTGGGFHPFAAGFIACVIFAATAACCVYVGEKL